jgi:hypothetical protein
MRRIIAMCVVAGFILSTVAPLAAQQQTAPKHDKKPVVQQAADSYVCPMHPEEKSTKPGKCAKCGMALEKKAEKPAQVMKKGSKKHEGKEKCGGCQEACGDK